MDARRFLDLARELVAGVSRNAPLTGGAGEAECRCAIGRAYYAAFLTSRLFLNQIGIALPPEGSSHTIVQHALNNAGVDVLGRVAGALRALYLLRTTADYNLSDTVTEKVTEASGAVGQSEFVITVFDLIRAGRVSPPVDLTAIANTILAWAKANGQESKIRKL
jgi:hypothetical protein